MNNGSPMSPSVVNRCNLSVTQMVGSESVCPSISQLKGLNACATTSPRWLYPAVRVIALFSFKKRCTSRLCSLRYSGMGFPKSMLKFPSRERVDSLVVMVIVVLMAGMRI